MNTELELQNPGKESSVFGRRVASAVISTIDRKRIFIFVAIAYGLSIAPYLVIFAGGERFSSYRNVASPQAGALRMMLMFAPMIAHVATRLITGEGWSNTFLRPDLRGGRWRYYLAAWFLPFVATIVGGAIYYLLFPGSLTRP